MLGCVDFVWCECWWKGLYCSIVWVFVCDNVVNGCGGGLCGGVVKVCLRFVWVNGWLIGLFDLVGI